MGTAQISYLTDYLWWYVVLASLVAHAYCFFRFFPRDRRPRLRLVLGNALVSLILLTVVGLVGETYLRFFCLQTDSYGVTLTSQRWMQRYVSRNAYGYRDGAWSPPRDRQKYRIACIGDSFTFGWGVDDPADRFTDRLQRRFIAAGRIDVEVMNVAHLGWETGDHLQAAADMIKTFGVREVVLCHCPNDIKDILPQPAGFDPTRPPTTSLVNIDSSYLVNWLFYRVYAPRAKRSVTDYFDWLATGYSDPQNFAMQCTMYDLLIKLCEKNSVRLRVALMPFFRYHGQKYDNAKIHAVLKSYFESRGVEVLDLLDWTADIDPSELVVNRFDHHPNAEAHGIFAEAMWNVFFKDEFGQRP